MNSPWTVPAQRLDSAALAKQPHDVKALSVEDVSLAELAPFTQLTRLQVRGPRFDLAWAQAMAKLPLETLIVNVVELPREAVEALAACRSLRWLSLNGGHEADIAGVGALTQLTGLGLGSAQVWESGFQSVLKLTQLRELDISHSYVPGKLLPKIVALTQLESLSASGLAWTQKGFEALTQLPTLRSLSLTSVDKITGPWWDAMVARGVLSSLWLYGATIPKALQGVFCDVLVKLPLRELNVSFCPWLDDAMVARLAALPTLEQLALARNPQLTDASLQSLAASATLREVDVDECAFTPAGLTLLAKAKALRRIDAGRSALDDAALLAWATALPLEHVTAWACPALTPAGFQAARALRPTCEFEVSRLLPLTWPRLHATARFAALGERVGIDATGSRLLVSGTKAAVLDAKTGKSLGACPTKILNPGGFSQTPWLLGVKAKTRQAVLWSPATRKTQDLAVLEHEDGRGAVSPDGKWFAVPSLFDLQLRSVDASGPTHKFEGNYIDAPATLFSPDSRWLASGGREGLRLFEVATGKQVWLKPELESPLAFLGDALLASAPDRSVRTLALTDGAERARRSLTENAKPVQVLVSGGFTAFLSVGALPLLALKPSPLIEYRTRGDGYVALAAHHMDAIELFFPGFVVKLGRESGYEVPRLSGDGEWLALPTSLGGEAVQLWSVQAILDYVRENAHVPPPAA